MKTIATSIRIPEELLKQIRWLSDKVGDSQNGMMLNLIYMGIKVYQSDISVKIKPSALCHPDHSAQDD